MKIIEVGTGYTSIPAKMGAATEIVVEEISKVFEKEKINYEIFDIKDEERKETNLKIKEVYVPKIFRKKDVGLGIMHKLKRIAYSISLAKSLKKEIKESDDELIIHFHNQYKDRRYGYRGLHILRKIQFRESLRYFCPLQQQVLR